MKKTIIDITNKNLKNNPKEDTYKSFNEFIK